MKKIFFAALLFLLVHALANSQTKEKTGLGKVRLGVFLNTQFNTQVNKFNYGAGLYLMRKEAPSIHFFEAGVNYEPVKTKAWNPFIQFEQAFYFYGYSFFSGVLKTDLILNKNTFASVSPGIAFDAAGLFKIYYNYHIYYYSKTNDAATVFRPHHSIGFMYRIRGLHNVFE